MHLRNSLQQLVVIMFIAMTVSGMSYTLFRYKLPGVPRSLRQFSYGMMAPYQTYRTHNEELTALGLTPDGTWEIINMDEYLPFVQGERAMRSYLLTFRAQGDEILYKKYTEFAQIIQRLESERGRKWEDIKLTIQVWPMSPAGFEYLRHDPFIESEFLVQLSKKT